MNFECIEREAVARIPDRLCLFFLRKNSLYAARIRRKHSVSSVTRRNRHLTTGREDKRARRDCRRSARFATRDIFHAPLHNTDLIGARGARNTAPRPEISRLAWAQWALASTHGLWAPGALLFLGTPDRGGTLLSGSTFAPNYLDFRTVEEFNGLRDRRI